MKKHSLIFMKCAVGLTILFGVLLILFTNEKSLKSIVSDDIENISKLSASTIYSEIDNSLTKPIYVAQTMANDSFLKSWLTDESSVGADAERSSEIQRYLMDYSIKYGYDSVFLVSEKSGTYYYKDGINKVISPENKHDVWYYDFINSGKSYDLDVDSDEANNNILTVFVNCRISDPNGELMGVVGVGIKMSNLQQLFAKYESEYNLKAFLMNKDGLVQIDSVVENIETANFFDNPEALLLKEKILNNKTSMEIFWYTEQGADHCLITYYVNNLDWYIVIEKDTSVAQQLLIDQIHRDLLLIGIIVALVLVFISMMIGTYNRMLLKTASIDDVTNLPNSKMFQTMYERNAKRPACHHGMVFMFDIDYFKDINDSYGHLFGNTILYRVSEAVQNAIGNRGIVSRWSVDEFAGVIYGTHDEVIETFNQMLTAVNMIHEGELTRVSISLGASTNLLAGNLDTALKEADAAMYISKETGKNQITVY
ncbi:MAG: sensor domain-containing diguanylate cyclase [Oscillospiraceae bacterium]